MKSGNVRRCLPIGTPLGTRFWAKVDKSGDCWTWTASCQSRGYGQFGVDGRMRTAHRVSWELANGPIPSGMVVMHTCDNPPCVRPDHLRLGTKADNSADMVAKGRAATGDRNGSRLYPERLKGHYQAPQRGASNGQARLTEEAVLEMRSLRLGVAATAARYGISKSQASRILAGKRWSHV